MPAYLYQCVHCQAQETRIGGLDDHLAICTYCRNLMVRLDFDLFSPCFEPLGVSEAEAEAVADLLTETSAQQLIQT